VSYDFASRHAESWPVAWLCEALGVSTAGYYSWRVRQACERSERQRRRDAVLVEIQTVHAEVKERYGSPRMHAELLDRGHDCCVNTVARIMNEAGIAAKTTRKFRQTTDSNHPYSVAENLLNREFSPESRNETWTADVTYISTREGWLYLAVVEDLYSRLIVGWSMDSTMTSRLVVDALEMAVARRLPEADLLGLTAHSDRGSQYASEHYQRLLEAEGITCSMSRRGDCWDNAPMESFFATLKKELVHHEDYETRDEARMSIFDYIEIFYNRQRRHSTLGYLSPFDFETAHP
jgi:putative transposase